MNKTVEFYYDYSSPNVYIAYTQLPQIAERTGAEIIWKPALLGGIFNEIGNRPPNVIPSLARWMWQDLMRFADYYEVPLKLNSQFPMRSVTSMRGALVAIREGVRPQYDDIMFRAHWVDDVDLNNPAEFARVLDEGGLDSAVILQGTQDTAIKQELITRTAEAVERGLFGMPTFFIGDEMHFGKDRLEWVERTLARDN